MNVIVEMTDELGLDYYFVNVKGNSEYIQLSSAKNHYKTLEENLLLDEICHYSLAEVSGLTELSFDCGKQHYRFIDYGTGIAKYLQKWLKLTVTI